MAADKWQAVTVAAAGTLSNTFGSSAPGTHSTVSAKGAIGVRFKATAISLPVATELRVTPRFVDADSTETFAAFAGGTPAYQVITTAERETEIYWDLQADNVGVEPWLDAADSNATCSLSLQLIFPER